MALHAGLGLESLVRPPCRLGAEGADVLLEDGVAAGVADRADLLEHSLAGQLVLEHELADQRPKRIQLRALALLLLRFGLYRPLDCLRVASELVGDGADAFALGPQSQDEPSAAISPVTLSLSALASDPSDFASRQIV